MGLRLRFVNWGVPISEVYEIQRIFLTRVHSEIGEKISPKTLHILFSYTVDLENEIDCCSVDHC
jgi:hypothetical protein